MNLFSRIKDDHRNISTTNQKKNIALKRKLSRRVIFKTRPSKIEKHILFIHVTLQPPPKHVDVKHGRTTHRLSLGAASPGPLLVAVAPVNAVGRGLSTRSRKFILPARSKSRVAIWICGAYIRH